MVAVAEVTGGMLSCGLQHWGSEMADAGVHGFCDERFAAVRDVFVNNLASGLDVGASFAVTVEGETVVDLWGGWANEARSRAWA